MKVASLRALQANPSGARASKRVYTESHTSKAIVTALLAMFQTEIWQSNLQQFCARRSGGEIDKQAWKHLSVNELGTHSSCCCTLCRAVTDPPCKTSLQNEAVQQQLQHEGHALKTHNTQRAAHCFCLPRSLKSTDLEIQSDDHTQRSRAAASPPPRHANSPYKQGQ